MFRNLIILAAIVLVVMIVRNRLRAQKPPIKTGDKQVESVRCAQCKQFLPKTSAVSQGERYFCNADHLKAWQEDSSR